MRRLRIGVSGERAGESGKKPLMSGEVTVKAGEIIDVFGKKATGFSRGWGKCSMSVC